MSNQIIKREDAIYKEIELFEDYELTQCVAYEMAIRSENNLKDINEFVRFYRENINTIEDERLNLDDFFSSEKYLELLIKLSYLEVIPFIPLETCHLFEESPYEEIFVDNLIYYEDKRVDKIIYEIINDLTIAEDGNKKRGLLSEQPRIISDDFIDTVSLEKRTFMNGYRIETIISETSEHAFIAINDSEETTELNSVDKWKRYVDEGGENLTYETKIISQYKRPPLKIQSNLYNKFPKLEIDLSKPLNEIVAYITHIKNDFENKDIFKAPIEVLGTELRKADNLICDTKGKCFDAREVLTKQQKIADMFFIYDCLKVGITQRKIQNEVYNYYMDKGIETITLDAKTLKKYREIAIDYIDNMRYKELVTGVKLEDL